MSGTFNPRRKAKKGFLFRDFARRTDRHMRNARNMRERELAKASAELARHIALQSHSVAPQAGR
jgi:hypothetical protein